MLAEIFMVRSEAKARLVEEVLPSSTSRFIPLSPRTQFTFKKSSLRWRKPHAKSRLSEWSSNDLTALQNCFSVA
jgi:hypothetical protein